MIIKKKLINEFLVVLMALILILSQTILHLTQSLLELTLIFLLTFFLLKRKLKIWEISLLLLVLITQLLSILVYDSSFDSFMLNTKVAGLTFLSIMYFRHNATASVSMKILFIICLLLVLIQYFITDQFPINIPQSLIYNLSIFNGFHPLGLFLDFHTSAYFLAVYLIGISLTRKLFFIDLIIIWLMGVKTSFLALIGQKFFTIAGNRIDYLKKFSVQIACVIVGIFLSLTLFLPFFLNFMELIGFSSGNSAKIMIRLISNPNVYLDSLSLLPMDLILYSNTYIYDVGVETFRYFEMTLISIMVIFGTPIGLILLYILLKFTPSFRVFILLSLLHYAAILNPLIIYLVFMFERKVREIKEK